MLPTDLEMIDLSYLPPGLAEKINSRLGLIMGGLKLIKWPIKAVVLGGGFKRRELTYADEDMASDIDIYVFSDFTPFFWKRLGRIQDEIDRPDHFFHYKGVIPRLLPKSRTFWAYKLKQEGIVLRGDEHILDKIRAESDNVPRIEAIRILFQSLTVWSAAAEFLAAQGGPAVGPPTILRNYLFIGESYLIFYGRLRPSYAERLEEFTAGTEEFGIEKELADKIALAYLTKVDPQAAEKRFIDFDLSMKQARADVLMEIDKLLDIYLNEKRSDLIEKIDLIAEEVPVRVLFNLFFYLRARKYRPRFFKTIFKFKLTDLWKLAIYNELGRRKDIDNLAAEYFRINGCSEKALVKLFELQPSFSTVEIT